MEEKVLIAALLIIGVACFSAIVFFNLKTQELVVQITGETLIPQFLCHNDTQGNYLLATNTSFEFCEKIDDISKIANPTFCEGYDERKMNACMGLVDIVGTRAEDCFGILFGNTETSVTNEEVKTHCDVIVS